MMLFMEDTTVREDADITIVGLGPGAFEQLSVGAWEALRQARLRFLRTAIHPTVQELTARGIRFVTFDELYDKNPDFESLYRQIAERVIAAASQGPVTYAVPGHPLVAEESVRLIMLEAERQGLIAAVVPSMSALDAIFAAARQDPVAGLQVFDALAFEPNEWIPGRPAVFLQLYNRFVASQLKLALLEWLEPTTVVTLIKAAGTSQEQVQSVALHELDRQPVDHLTSLFLPGTAHLPPPGSVHSLAPLTEVMKRLLAPDGCPWDREQTHSSLGRFLIEETYEVIEAIESQDYEALCEELGDVLLQVVFHAQLAEENGAFNIDDVIQTITEKMKRRHPHVFGDVQAADAKAVLANWEAIKQAERKEEDPQEKSLLSDLPRHLPALMYAEKAQKKAATVGFQWQNVHGAWEKLHEEIRELEEAIAAGNLEEQDAELGDVLFVLVNVARYLGIDPEAALRRTTEKFIRRFRFIEQSAARRGQTLHEMTLSEMDAYWNEAKKRGS
jgi:tetrapyrrole methylase family protein/MazG family protein